MPRPKSKPKIFPRHKIIRKRSKISVYSQVTGTDYELIYKGIEKRFKEDRRKKERRTTEERRKNPELDNASNYKGYRKLKNSDIGRSVQQRFIDEIKEHAQEKMRDIMANAHVRHDKESASKHYFQNFPRLFFNFSKNIAYEVRYLPHTDTIYWSSTRRLKPDRRTIQRRKAKESIIIVEKRAKTK